MRSLYCIKRLTPTAVHEKCQAFTHTFYELKTQRGRPLRLANPSRRGLLVNRINRLINPENSTSRSSGWGAFSVCTAMTIVVIGIASLSTNNTAFAQNQTEEATDRLAEVSHVSEFPTEQQMAESVASEVTKGNLTPVQAETIMRIHKRLVMGLASGKLSTIDAIAIMDARAKAIFEDDATMIDKGTNSRRLYDEALAKMTEMVKAGEITREQMEQRLKRMKQRMEKERTITKKDYDQALAKMTEMVKAGEITREQMEQRLERMGRIVAGEDQPDGTSDECRVLGIVLRKAVSTGEMTAEEAKAAWEAACGKK